MKNQKNSGAWVIEISLNPQIFYFEGAVADGFYRYETFAKAKRALIKELKIQQTAWSDAIKYTNRLTDES
jgi:hypothetical protein